MPDHRLVDGVLALADRDGGLPFEGLQLYVQLIVTAPSSTSGTAYATNPARYTAM
ncbi:hypothetical protein [Streptomyces sp. Ac-502]|uniref:hypothetical protein n=1 Tax=Streptomyces sp. Ac-502 TaxID=3342801 RepID=UPI0038623ABA